MIIVTDTENNFYSKFRYLSFFVTRAFLLAIFVIMCIIIVFCALYFGDMYLNVKNGDYKAPLFGGYVIVSRSMSPTINVNDAIVIKRENNNKYDIGDIISFFSTEYDRNGMVVTHRVVDKTDDGNMSSYITKGDNNPVADGNSVSINNVYGKVMFVIPKLGYIHNYLSNPKNLILCLLIPVLFIFIYESIRIKKVFDFKRESLH